jgi:Bifunctional DNA primase/polymerase, N-terminal/D5 N terminal like
MSETVETAALAYAKRGWKPVPVNRETKKPRGKGWQQKPFDPHAFNGNANNVGIQLGAVSNGLNDVDLDCVQAIGLAPEFLPPTAATFGRRSKPCSHQLYVTDLHTTEKKAAIQFAEYSNGKRGAMLVELRTGGGDKGAQTTVPPSMHVTGEMVEWVSNGEPARVDGAALKHAVTKLAVAALLARHYPSDGSRHAGCLAIGGVLARAGWDADTIGQVVEAAARAAGDDDISDRSTAARSAVEAKANGHDIAGLTSLAEKWGEDVATTFRHWFRVHAQHAGKGAGLEDSTALTFAEQHADDYRYVAKNSQWMRWATTRWEPEDTLHAFDMARKLCREAGDAKAKTVAAVVTLARSDRRMAATADQWDAQSKIINTPTKEAP